MLDFEIVREHCKGKKAHKARTAHKAHGCTPARKKPSRRAAAAARRGKS